MTISTTDSSIAYSGNGVTLAFAVPFRFLVDADLTVTLRSTAGVESTLVLNTNYTLTGANDDAGGTLTMVVAPAVGERLVIERIVGITQETDYPEGSNFPAEAHERALDRLTMIGQQLLRSISRCFQLPTSGTGNPVISSSASLANKFLTFDASENLTVAAGTALSGVIVTPLAETLVGRATAALMRSDLGAFPLARNYHQGFTLSTVGSSTTITIGSGQCTDSTNATLIDLSAAMPKTTGAWAVGSGNGGRDTGALANNTWYHFYAIRRPDTNVVDIIFSLSATSPTMPTNYTEFRWIGVWRTNGSGQWATCFQVGDDVFWKTLTLAFGSTIYTSPRTVEDLTASVDNTLPKGIRVKAYLSVTASQSTSGSGYVIFSDLDFTDEGVRNQAQVFAPSTTIQGTGEVSVRTDTNAQIGIRGNVTSGNVSAEVYCRGFNIAEAKGR